MKLNNLNLTREELYEKVWTTSISSIARNFSTRDHDIIKICDDNNIPRPPSGYWSRVKHGYQIDRPPLLSFNQVTETNSNQRPTVSRMEPKPRNKPKPPDVPRVDINKPELTKPHPLVTKTYKAYKSIHPDKYDRLRSQDQILSVWVGYNSLDRAMSFMNIFLNELELRGYSISIERQSANESWATIAKVNSEAVPFHLEEGTSKNRIINNTNQRWHGNGFEYKATGVLSFVIDHFVGEGLQKSWNDTKVHKIEEKIAEIIQGMIQASEKVREFRIRSEKMREEMRIAEEKRKKTEEEARRKKDQIASLESCSLTWEKVTRIRNFISAIEVASIEKFGKLDSENPITSFLELAKFHVDSTDPIIQTLKQFDPK